MEGYRVSQVSKIEWTDCSWNPVTGCTKISPGCANCYAEAMARRLEGIGHTEYQNGFKVTLQKHRIYDPLKWKKSKKIFVNSMSDLFHQDVPLQYIQAVFKVMAEAKQHTFQVLTKRAERLGNVFQYLEWPDNVWMGVSVESESYIPRIEHLLKVPAKVRFISFEPLIDEVTSLNLTGIHWVIAGGESGQRARQMKPEWIRSIRDACIEQDIPFFFKQWDKARKKELGRTLDGIKWEEFPKMEG